MAHHVQPLWLIRYFNPHHVYFIVDLSIMEIFLNVILAVIGVLWTCIYTVLHYVDNYILICLPRPFSCDSLLVRKFWYNRLHHTPISSQDKGEIWSDHPPCKMISGCFCVSSQEKGEIWSDLPPCKIISGCYYVSSQDMRFGLTSPPIWCI